MTTSEDAITMRALADQAAAQTAARLELPLSDWRCTRPHTADECDFERCSCCGCCAHGQPQASGCLMDNAPRGSQCGNAFSHGCACEGRS